MMSLAKGMTNATVPASAVVMKRSIYDAFMTGPEWMVELTPGYTYSAHPLAVAAGLTTLDVYAEEGLFQRPADLAPHFADAIHGRTGRPNHHQAYTLGISDRKRTG